MANHLSGLQIVKFLYWWGSRAEEKGGYIMKLHQLFNSLYVCALLALCLMAGSLAFVVPCILFGSASAYVYKEWKLQRSFIYVAAHHRVVEPSSRRDVHL